ncbi:ATP synthase F1, delta subunit [Verruconis gallopava]|uniref:ATP synthase subunit 5, mitochondrial n=1 Tax=Verruconis gallopava TaxID=253628 RepID=A0A0D1XUQ2_9PEZI|nr:ATP synthase F1, delta subunit [Verruconis gallopava]KIW06471.1 ATP synthase F1, delta subunit [Verruconis gallopava]
MLAGRFAVRTARTMAPRVSMAARRCYAAAASETKPPIELYGVDGTYASALYTAAAKTSALDPVAKAMENLLAVIKKDTKLVSILEAPALTAEDKAGITSELLKHTGGADKDNIVKNFLTTLAENNRLGALAAVAENFGKLMSAHKGEVELIVTSAAPLEPKVLKQLENAVGKSQYVGQGKKLKVVPKVNPDIRGGLIVEIGDRTIDLSVSAKMAKMNKLLRDQL